MPNSAKWCSAQSLDLRLDAEAPISSPDRPRQFDPEHIARVSGNVTASRLVNGTEGGRSVVVFQVDLDDGSTVCFETSLRLLAAAVHAFKTRDEVEGRPA